MRSFAGAIGLILLLAAGLFGADNILTPREKADGWVLLFDGQSLNGWSSSVPEAGGRGRGPDGVPKQAKAPSPSDAAPSVGSHRRTCSSSIGQAEVASVLSYGAGPCG